MPSSAVAVLTVRPGQILADVGVDLDADVSAITPGQTTANATKETANDMKRVTNPTIRRE